MYKYFSENSVWSELNTVSLHSCRYITDFGLELLSRCVGKNISRLVDLSKLHGCTQVFNYLHENVTDDLLYKDIFTSYSFTGLHLHSKEADFENMIDSFQNNSFKVAMVNESSLNLIEFLKTGNVSNERPPILNYAHICFSKKNDFAFNVYESHSVCFKNLSILRVFLVIIKKNIFFQKELANVFQYSKLDSSNLS